MKNKRMKFKTIGGSRQVVLRSAEDLRVILELEPALWAVTSLPLDSLVADREFLEFIDTDQNGRIRPSELRAAVEWMLNVLKDHSGVSSQSDRLDFSALNETNPEANAILESAKLLLRNLGKEQDNGISLPDARNRDALIRNTLNNGDGVIVPENVTNPELSAFLSAAGTCEGLADDVGGGKGINAELLGKFETDLKNAVEWQSSSENPELLPFGEKTELFYAHFIAVKEKIDEYFKLCGAFAGTPSDRFELNSKTDPLDTAAMNEFFQKAPVAHPSVSSALERNGWLNPLYRNAVLDLLGDLGAGRLTESEWNSLKGKFAPRTEWLKKKPSDAFCAMDQAAAKKYRDGTFFEEVKKLIEADVVAAKHLEAWVQLKKVILFQRYMLEFVNNFVCLEELFNPDMLSLAQPGRLVMDGRYFTLSTKVVNIAEHKKIISRSDICVMYVELVTGRAPDQKKMTLATAITAGTMRDIFIGKAGVFFSPDGTEWDAKVVDLVQQPVSFTEALQMPFFRLGEFAGKQADKFFSTQSKTMETNVQKDLSQNLPPPPGSKPQTPAVSGSMMLMGGGVGIAALGTAFAFIVNTLKNISVWNVIAVFIGMCLVISGPILLVSLIKLWNRSISDFLSASGWAVNPRMRMSRKMGGLFTQTPKLPPSLLLGGDLIESFSKKIQSPGDESVPLRKLLVVLLTGILCTAVLVYYFLYR